MPQAARVTDIQICPMVQPGIPPIPHVEGVIVSTTAVNVLIDGLPAANMASISLCPVGPPAMYGMGVASVELVGSPAVTQEMITTHDSAVPPIPLFPMCLIGDDMVGFLAAAAADSASPTRALLNLGKAVIGGAGSQAAKGAAKQVVRNTLNALRESLTEAVHAPEAALDSIKGIVASWRGTAKTADKAGEAADDAAKGVTKEAKDLSAWKQQMRSKARSFPLGDSKGRMAKLLKENPKPSSKIDDLAKAPKVDRADPATLNAWKKGMLEQVADLHEGGKMPPETMDRVLKALAKRPNNTLHSADDVNQAIDDGIAGMRKSLDDAGDDAHAGHDHGAQDGAGQAKHDDLRSGKDRTGDEKPETPAEQARRESQEQTGDLMDQVGQEQERAASVRERAASQKQWAKAKSDKDRGDVGIGGQRVAKQAGKDAEEAPRVDPGTLWNKLKVKAGFRDDRIAKPSTLKEWMERGKQKKLAKGQTWDDAQEMAKYKNFAKKKLSPTGVKTDLRQNMDLTDALHNRETGGATKEIDSAGFTDAKGQTVQLYLYTDAVDSGLAKKLAQLDVTFDKGAADSSSLEVSWVRDAETGKYKPVVKIGQAMNGVDINDYTKMLTQLGKGPGAKWTAKDDAAAAKLATKFKQTGKKMAENATKQAKSFKKAEEAADAAPAGYKAFIANTKMAYEKSKLKQAIAPLDGLNNRDIQHFFFDKEDIDKFNAVDAGQGSFEYYKGLGKTQDEIVDSLKKAQNKSKESSASSADAGTQVAKDADKTDDKPTETAQDDAKTDDTGTDDGETGYEDTYGSGNGDANEDGTGNDTSGKDEAEPARSDTETKTDPTPVSKQEPQPKPDEPIELEPDVLDPGTADTQVYSQTHWEIERHDQWNRVSGTATTRKGRDAVIGQRASRMGAGSDFRNKLAIFQKLADENGTSVTQSAVKDSTQAQLDELKAASDANVEVMGKLEAKVGEAGGDEPKTLGDMVRDGDEPETAGDAAEEERGPSGFGSDKDDAEPAQGAKDDDATDEDDENAAKNDTTAKTGDDADKDGGAAAKPDDGEEPEEEMVVITHKEEEAAKTAETEAKLEKAEQVAWKSGKPASVQRENAGLLWNKLDATADREKPGTLKEWSEAAEESETAVTDTVRDAPTDEAPATTERQTPEEAYDQIAKAILEIKNKRNEMEKIYKKGINDHERFMEQYALSKVDEEKYAREFGHSPDHAALEARKNESLKNRKNATQELKDFKQRYMDLQKQRRNLIAEHGDDIDKQGSKLNVGELSDSNDITEYEDFDKLDFTETINGNNKRLDILKIKKRGFVSGLIKGKTKDAPNFHYEKNTLYESGMALASQVGREIGTIKASGNKALANKILSTEMYFRQTSFEPRVSYETLADGKKVPVVFVNMTNSATHAETMESLIRAAMGTKGLEKNSVKKTLKLIEKKETRMKINNYIEKLDMRKKVEGQGTFISEKMIIGASHVNSPKRAGQWEE